MTKSRLTNYNQGYYQCHMESIKNLKIQKHGNREPINSLQSDINVSSPNRYKISKNLQLPVTACARKDAGFPDLAFTTGTTEIVTNVKPS